MTAPVAPSQPSSNGCVSAEDREALDQVYIAHLKKLMDAQTDRIATMESALKPFAKLADLAHVDHRDSRPVIFGFDTAVAQRLTIGDLRAARAALEENHE